ncbi:MAG: SurA N-terminal domain-containing protein [Devosia nanyangense]|uniref:SurA N-terminal domain-containing protein n=1 Tax=Devosia nanyangense TaxID=1228055 RepID=A0A933NX95_9HYPH|nr:SurA N-terminal domain-containing protein [Devosia nanyangense]
MLNFLRRFASTWMGKVLGAFLLLAMASFGVPSVLSTLNANTLASVGGEDITIQEFQRAYQQQLNQFAQQTGQMPTNEQALQLGIPTAVISKLASDAAINQFGVRLGIGVSDARLAKMVRDDPSFAGVLGTFERANFDQVLRQNGYTEAEYFELQTRAVRRQQIALGLFAGTAVSKAALDILNRYRNDTRTVEYFTLNATSLPSAAEPTDDDLKAYLTAHQADFRTKETRTAEVVLLTPDILAPQYAATEDEILAEYDRTKDQLVKVERRDIQQVTLPDAAAEKVFTDQQAAGASFADALKASGLTATDIGLLSKTEVSDAALAEAAFGLAKEGDFAIIAGIGGKRVVAVTKIEAGGQTSYDEAKADIAARLALAKAKAAYVDIQDQVEELRAAFKPLKEIADRFKLPLATVALTADGAALSVVTGLEDTDRTKVATAIFKAEQGKLAPTVAFSATKNLWFDLSKIEAARDQTLDEVHDAVATAWTNGKTEEALQAEVKAAVDELQQGTSIQLVSSEYNADTKTSQPFTRDGDKTNVFNQQVATQIFSAGPDSRGSALDGDGDYVIYHVLEVTPPTAEPDANIKDFLSNSTRDALYAEFIGGLRDEAGIKINQQTLSTVLNLDQTAQ